MGQEQRSRLQRIIYEDGDVTTEDLERLMENASPEEQTEILKLVHDDEEPRE